jgi:RHS repeat-associated protein
VNPANNQIQGVSGLSYDANGNQNVGTYDAENRLSSAQGLTYAYDAQNERIWSWNGGTDGSNNPTGYSVVMYSPTGQKLATYQLTPQWLQGWSPSIWMQVALVSSDQYFGSRRLAVLGQLGSVGTYFPWGEDKGSTNPQNTWSFATYWRDSGTNLDYANNRYYSNAYGRFMTPDPYKASGSPSDPQTWNRYPYAGGDPVNRVDPSGRDYVDPIDPSLCDGDSGFLSCDPGGPGFCDASEGPGACDNTCVAADGFTPMPGPNCAADGGALPVAAPPVELDCTLKLFRRPAKFKGDPGQHTYLDLCVDLFCEIVEGGRDNKKNDATYGDLIGFINAPGTPGVLGANTHHGSNPGHDTQLGSTQSIPCADIGDINTDVGYYNGQPARYAFLPNGTSTFNSNSFTYTLLEALGLQNDFGSLPTNILGGIPFYPGWGYTLPGLNVFGLN